MAVALINAKITVENLGTQIIKRKHTKSGNIRQMLDSSTNKTDGMHGNQRKDKLFV